MRLELRCCCDASRLLGWVDVPPELAGEASLTFRLIDADADAELSSIEKRVCAQRASEMLTLELTRVVRYYAEIGGRHLSRSSPALKSHDVPLAMLRRIPGFIENKA